MRLALAVGLPTETLVNARARSSVSSTHNVAADGLLGDRLADPPRSQDLHESRLKSGQKSL